MKKSNIKGVSLVESLIGLSLLLFIFFVVFSTFSSLILNQSTLKSSIESNQQLNSAIAEFQISGNIDTSKYSITFLDNT